MCACVYVLVFLSLPIPTLSPFHLLLQVGWDRPDANAPSTVKNNFVSLLYAVRLILQSMSLLLVFSFLPAAVL
jgi:hypothetical protein